MGWRIINIEDAARLNYKLNCIGIYINDEYYWINFDEIDTIVISDLRCNISIRLIKELMENGINVIICGLNHMPIGTMLPFQNNSRSSKYNQLQISWKQETKQKLWQLIVKAKIALQIEVLLALNKNNRIELLCQNLNDVELGDITNREGHAAKVYFHELFGKAFNRQDESIINSCLNYIYQIIRSKISQVIVSHGYLPSVGIFHCNEYNYFNLADDLIEVFRPICDLYVFRLLKETESKFLTPEFKLKLSAILIEQVKADDRREYNNFVKKLKKEGFYMLQYSVYVKVLINDSEYKRLINRIPYIIPKKGNILMLKVTEKQYQDMIYLNGEKNRYDLIVGSKQLILFGGEKNVRIED
jgi:CRISPR-associated protein Cas1